MYEETQIKSRLLSSEKEKKIKLKRIPASEVNFVLCLRKSREDAVKACEYCMNVCTNKIPINRYQIFQKYKYLINLDLRRQSAYSSVISVCLLAGEVQAKGTSQVSFHR